MPIVDMISYHKKEKEELIREVEKLKSNEVTPRLWIISDGEDEKCTTYMKSKLKISGEVGVDTEVKLISNVSELKLTMEEAYNNDVPVILQLPIKKEIEEAYNNLGLYYRGLDVDGFFSYQELMEGDWSNAPCTSKGVAKYILDKYDSIRGKVIVMIGYGKLTNKPLSTMLSSKGATCVVTNSSTTKEFKESILKQADIVVCASGIKGSVKVSDLSDNKEVLVMNIGTMFDENGKLTTELEVDIEKDNVIYSPRIGGVGILTTANLMWNTLEFHKKLI